MENLISRYRNVTILVAILFAQVLGLAVQVKRSTGADESSRLIRVWAVGAVTPLERAIVWCQTSASNIWHNYFYLRGVRQENRDLKQEIQLLRIEQVRLSEDAEQAHRLQALLGFKEQYIAKTLAAQVIGSSGSEQSRSVYIDKGSRDGIKPDMAVITADGVVGKVLRVFGRTSQVLLINDQTSGVGALLEKSRLQGVLRGTPVGEVVLEKVMTDETVQPGEKVVTSGGDEIFPKGLAVGTVTKVSPGPELFLNIRVRPAADLSRLEEVLVITEKKETQPTVDTEHLRAADILAQRLPSVPEHPLQDLNAPPPPTSGLKIVPAPGAAAQASNTATGTPKPMQTTPFKVKSQPISAGGTPAKSVAIPATTKPAGSAAIVPAAATKPASTAPKPAEQSEQAPVASQSEAKPKSPANRPDLQPQSQEQPH